MKIAGEGSRKMADHKYLTSEEIAINRSWAADVIINDHSNLGSQYWAKKFLNVLSDLDAMRAENKEAQLLQERTDQMLNSSLHEIMATQETYKECSAELQRFIHLCADKDDRIAELEISNRDGGRIINELNQEIAELEKALDAAQEVNKEFCKRHDEISAGEQK